MAQNRRDTLCTHLMSTLGDYLVEHLHYQGLTCKDAPVHYLRALAYDSVHPRLFAAALPREKAAAAEAWLGAHENVLQKALFEASPEFTGFRPAAAPVLDEYGLFQAQWGPSIVQSEATEDPREIEERMAWAGGVWANVQDPFGGSRRDRLEASDDANELTRGAGREQVSRRWQQQDEAAMLQIAAARQEAAAGRLRQLARLGALAVPQPEVPHAPQAFQTRRPGQSRIRGRFASNAPPF